MRAAYLDASALTKLFKEEPETEPLAAAVGEWPVWASSELIAVEARCTARRLGGVEMLRRAETVLRKVDLIDYTRGIRDRAGEVFVPALRALDALHAATILEARSHIAVAVIYDADLASAVAASGMEVIAPGPA